MLLSYLFVYSFSRGKTNYAKALGTLSLTIEIYLLGYLMEINATQLSDMIFWNQVQYFGIPFFPALWLVVSILYTGRDHLLSAFGWLLIFIIPVISFIARSTNGLHGLYYTDISITYSSGVPLMFLSKGPLYILHMLYVLVTLVMCTWFYFIRYKNSEGDDKMQFKLLLTASILPYLALVMVAINFGGTGIDFTAIILPPCVFLINLALTRYNFLEITGLAREKVFEDSTDGLILINRNYQIVSYNPASQTYLNWFDVTIDQKNLNQLLSNQKDVLDNIYLEKEEIYCLNVNQEERYICVNVKSVHNRQEVVGHLITLVDVTEKEKLKRKLISMAGTDELSGLNNRRKFTESAKEAFNRAARYQESICVLMMDIDYFKKINDAYGHQTGDEVIRAFSNMLKNVFRGSDIIGRMGGEEFAVVLLNVSLDSAIKKSETFRRLVESNDMIIADYKINITVSIGVAMFDVSTLSLDALINQADRALYLAKNSGRNQTKIV